MKKEINNFFHDKTKILFILLVLSLVVLPMTYSRYIGKDLGSTDTHIAKWNVEAIGDDAAANLVLKNVNEYIYNLSVTSTSEVACDYTIIISGVPDGISLTIDDDTDNIYNPDENHQIIVENIGHFEVNSENVSHNHMLTFAVDDDAQTGEFELDLHISFKQKLQNIN